MTQLSNDTQNAPFDLCAVKDLIKAHIKAGRADLASIEINKPWPGMQDDIALIARQRVDELMTQGVLHVFLQAADWSEDGKGVLVKFPAWLFSSNILFAEKYPDRVGREIRFQKSVAVLQRRLAPFRDGLADLQGVYEALKDRVPPEAFVCHSKELH